MTCSMLGAERTVVRCEVVPIPRCPGTVHPSVLTHGVDKPVPQSPGQGEAVPAPAQLSWRRGSSSQLDAQTHVPIASASGHQQNIRLRRSSRCHLQHNLRTFKPLLGKCCAGTTLRHQVQEVAPAARSLSPHFGVFLPARQHQRC